MFFFYLQPFLAFRYSCCLCVCLCVCLWVNPQFVCGITCRADTIPPAHDTIRYVIGCTQYDMFRDTFAILSWEAEACDHCLQSEAPHSTYDSCLRSYMRSGYNNGGLLRVSRCSVFLKNLLVLLEYTGCYLWYLVFLNGMCYNCTVSYRIFLRAYRDMYRSLCIAGILVCRGIVSALITCGPFKPGSPNLVKEV